jgi:hypothetical protein
VTTSSFMFYTLQEGTSLTCKKWVLTGTTTIGAKVVKWYHSKLYVAGNLKEATSTNTLKERPAFVLDTSNPWIMNYNNVSPADCEFEIEGMWGMEKETVRHLYAYAECHA